jgi:hypothetical protein
MAERKVQPKDPSAKYAKSKSTDKKDASIRETKFHPRQARSTRETKTLGPGH